MWKKMFFFKRAYMCVFIFVHTLRKPIKNGVFLIVQINKNQLHNLRNFLLWSRFTKLFLEVMKASSFGRDGGALLGFNP